MKKLLSILLVLAMVLSLGITAFADEQTGTITVTNATKDRIYKAYKIFGATISTDANGKTAVSYIAAGSPYFDKIFPDTTTYNNRFFVYNTSTGTVTKKEGVNDADLIDYLTKLVQDSGLAASKTITADSDTITFTDMPYGYYLITSSLGSTVTINSNTPNVSIIDKNQKPGSGFDKLIQTGLDENGDPTWGDSNSANIGDEVTYKISFEATNYDGDKKIKYYQVHDEKGEAIWAEFNSFKVTVDGKELPRGYYLDQANLDNGDWEFLNENSDHEDSWKKLPQNEKTRDNAQWYMVHLGENEFRITIPWLDRHTLKDVTNNADEVVSYALEFEDDSDSKFTSPSLVEITYNAVVEADAAIGNTTHGNRFNKAYASWTSEHETGYTTPEEVVTYVYGIGLLKDDIATSVNLAGAEFRVYKDAACTHPVYLLPTKIAGVYIVDSFNTPLATVSGTGKDTSRDLYAAYLGDYLTNEEGEDIPQNNLVVSQANGKLVILGLKAGTYYLQEVKAPSGYNALTQAVEFKVGENIRPFSIFAKEDGSVADIQQTDGIHTEIRYDLTHTVVHNSQGVVLPSTGGEGTMMLITIGAVLAIGFAVFLITHKKMSVYTD